MGALSPHQKSGHRTLMQKRDGESSVETVLQEKETAEVLPSLCLPSVAVQYAPFPRHIHMYEYNVYDTTDGPGRATGGCLGGRDHFDRGSRRRTPRPGSTGRPDPLRVERPMAFSHHPEIGARNQSACRSAFSSAANKFFKSAPLSFFRSSRR